MRYIKQPFPAVSLLALAATARALPWSNKTALFGRGEATFNLNVWNNCKFVKMVMAYTVNERYEVVKWSEPTNIWPGQELVIPVPFYGVGGRLSGHGEWSNQYQPQLLFEFGYSSYAGHEGTSYDISMMTGSDPDIGMGVWPIDNGYGSSTCETKITWPWYAPHDQAWTDPNQVQEGSPADTTCYQGKTDFKIVYCP